MSEPWEDFGGISTTETDSGPWNDFIFDAAREDKRKELARQTLDARIEGEQAKATLGLANIGERAAYTIADALGKVDVTGTTANILARSGYQRTPPLMSPEQARELGSALVAPVQEFAHGTLGVPITAPPEGKIGQVVEGAKEFASEMASGFTDPGMIVPAGASRYLPQEMARLFQMQMLGTLPQSAEAALNAQNLQEGVRTGLGLAANVALPIALGKTASAVPKTTEQIRFDPKLPSEPSILAAEQAKKPWEMTAAEFAGESIGAGPNNPIVSAAALGKSGQVYRSPLHAQAYEKAKSAGDEPIGGYDREQNVGYVTRNGRFIPSVIAENRHVGLSGEALGKGEAKEKAPSSFDPDHLRAIRQALDEGKAVPPEVLKEYPDSILAPEKTDVQVVTPAEPTKGLITGRAIESWADEVLRGGGTHLGPDVLAAYMVKGAALIERGIINFAEWSAKMIADHGEGIKPYLESLYGAANDTVNRAPITDKSLLRESREIIEQRLAPRTEQTTTPPPVTPPPSSPLNAMTEGEQIKMRKSAERATESPAIPEPIQERIETAPESFYRVQPSDLVENAVKGMSDAQLVSVPSESNLFVAARLEAANRLFTAGNMEAGYQIFTELEKQGTSFGQNINQFKRLPGTLPEHTAFVINENLKKSGKDPLTTEQSTKAIELTKASKQADAALDAATEAWRKNPTADNAKVAENALLKANNSAIELQRFISRFDPKSTASVLKSILQGNLLTPISEVANIFGNMSFLPFRAMDRTIAAGLDILDNALLGRKREVSVSPVGGTASALSGLRKGASQIPGILFRGTGDTIKGESRAGLHPVEAWINQFSKNPEMPTTGGKLTLQDRVNLALEGTFGVPAEMMLRGLGAGDSAFKEAAKARVITEQLRLHKVPKNQWSFARQFPELFFDRAVMEQIKGDTLAAVFQRNSKTIGHITNWIRGGGDLFDLAIATVAPYKLTPWNLIGEILSYNPVVALSCVLVEAKRGNTRSAKINAGKYLVGGMLTAAGWWLYKNQLLAPSLDERTEAQKARVLADQVLPPNHINISGLERKLKGGDPTFQPGDRTVDIFKGGGLAGSIFYMTANIGRSFERQPEAESSEHIGALIRQSTLEQARFGMNQSFLSGVEGILTAVKDGNTDNYVRQYMNTVLSIPMPNSMATLSRAIRENQPDFRADGFLKQVENTVRSKLGFAGLDDYLPLKRGLWGEPLPQTPKGANALFYHFFDISKNRQVTDDPVPIALYKLWRDTADTRAIPSLPEKTVTFGGTTYALTPEQRSAYSELVGKSRRQIVDSLVVNPNFYKLNNEVKLKILDRAYGTGMDIGKAKFWAGFKDQLEPKAKRAGFQ